MSDSESSAAPACTNELTVAQAIARELVNRDIDLVFGIPGGPLMPATEALSNEPRLRQVLARHEAGAAQMADGYFRATGRIAAVAVTAGPGTTNLMTALALAYREHVPMLVLAAQVSTSSYGLGAAQELDTRELLRPITKQSVELTNAGRIVDTLNDLLRIALTPRQGPVALIVPTDLFRRPAPSKPPPLVGRSASTRTVRACDPAEVEVLAALLKRARRPFVLAGRGAVLSGAGAELRALADCRPDLLFAATPRAKGIFPEDHAQSSGVLGLGGHVSAEEGALEQADLLIVLGTRLGEISSAGWDPRFRSRRIVQVDIDSTELGRVFPVELGITGDIRTVLRSLLAELRSSPEPCAPRALAAPLPTPPPLEPSSPIHPSTLMAAIDRVFPQNGHLFVDIGNTMLWATHYLRRTVTGRFHVNLIYGAMGHAIPAAVGASFRAPDPVLAITGDAAFLMSCMELGTLVQERLRMTTVVLNDAGHGMVEVGRKALFPDSKIAPVLFDPPPDIAGIGRALGLHSVSVHDARDLDRTLREALDGSRSTLIDVHIDRTAWPPMGTRVRSLLEAYSGATAAASPVKGGKS
jgi:acetolactate synthase-1/2/3 large subunit